MLMTTLIKKVSSTALVALLCCLPLAAQALEAPKGKVILTVSGNITHTNVDGTAQFDREMLVALGMHSVTTHTPWHEGAPTFEGPLGSALLDAVGAKGTNLKVTALNDYSANVPVADFYTHEVMMAMKEGGKWMRVRNKGPLFVLYPFDQKPELNTEVIHNRSVWQIKAITVE